MRSARLVRFAGLLAILVLLTPAAIAADNEEGKNEPRVQAKEPTVVTVRGSSDRVEEHRDKPKARGRRVLNGVGAGAAAVWNGLVGVGGWLLNERDDVPSERERQRSGSKPDQ